jgi:amidohydrolase
MAIDFKKIEQSTELLYEKAISYREHLHQNPELSYKEYNSQKFVSDTLTAIGIENSDIGETGIVALILADHHDKNDTCIALRADLDALPIQEQNKVPYKSKVDGVMHACGHDVHTSILLGAAEIIHENRNELKRPVKLIFQPGEEKNPGGATYVIRDGGLENPKVEKMIALHVFPDLDYGHFGFKEGLYMASCDELHIDVQGLGGHGALPERTVNPLFMGSEFILKAKEYIDKNTPEDVPSVINFGHFEALGATNVVPESAFIKGTFRTMDEDWRAKAKTELLSIASEISKRYNGNIRLNLSHGYPFLKNDEELTHSIQELTKRCFGADHVHELPLRMTSEDFAYYSQLVPVCFLRLGVRNEEKGIVHGLHHPKFDIEPLSIKKGIQIMTSIVFSDEV